MFEEAIARKLVETLMRAVDIAKTIDAGVDYLSLILVDGTVIIDAKREDNDVLHAYRFDGKLYLCEVSDGQMKMEEARSDEHQH